MEGLHRLINTFIKRHEEKENNDKEQIYKSIKPSWCLSKHIKPKLSRNISYVYFRYNNNIINSNKNQLYTFNIINNLPKNPLFRNKRPFSGFFTCKSY